MTRRSRLFATGTVLSTLVIPGALIALSPFDEPRHVFGVSCGWGLALVVLVPSFMAMTRVMASGDDRRIHACFMYSMMARFAASLLAVGLFATQVEQPPLFDFVLSFFFGFVVLTALELTSLLAKSLDRNHA